jgi:uncharacterized membrane protein HdeD (DUF308 family)
LDTTLLRTLGRTWWLVLLRGIAALAFGIMALAWPKLTLFVLVAFWGAYALMDGVIALVAGVRTRDGGKPMWAMILVGLLGIGAGVLTFLWPGMTALALLMFIAAWAVAMGVFQIAAAIRLRKEIENEWFLGLSGLLSVIFGVLMFLNPGAGALTVVWLIAVFSIAFGILLVLLAFKLKPHAAATAPA